MTCLNVLIFLKNVQDCPEKVTLIFAGNGNEIAAYFEMTNVNNLKYKKINLKGD